MARPEALRLLRIARRDLRMASRLLDPEVEEASWGWASPPRQHSSDVARHRPTAVARAFTSFAVQYRYDDEPEELSLDRTAWCESRGIDRTGGRPSGLTVSGMR